MRSWLLVLVLAVIGCQYNPPQAFLSVGVQEDAEQDALSGPADATAVDAAVAVGDVTPVDGVAEATADDAGLVGADTALGEDAPEGDAQEVTQADTVPTDLAVDASKQAVECPEGCDDGNSCTVDTCLNGKCQNSILDCTDTDPCTVDTCFEGLCQHQAKDCSDQNPCTDNFCDETGACAVAFAVTPCDDGNACTGQDACQKGACKGTPASCEDGDFCTVDTCDATKGCQHVYDSTPCQDNNPCTTKETCVGNSCYTSSTNCDDGNVCTVDSCNPTKGCQHEAVGGTTYCPSTDPTTYSICAGSSCVKAGDIFCPKVNAEVSYTTGKTVFWKDERATLLKEYNACVLAKQCPPLVGDSHYTTLLYKVAAGDKPDFTPLWKCPVVSADYKIGKGSQCTDPNIEPVAKVDNASANAYCKWRGGRVPTSDEMLKLIPTQTILNQVVPDATCTDIGYLTDVPSKLYIKLYKCGNTTLSAPYVTIGPNPSNTSYLSSNFAPASFPWQDSIIGLPSYVSPHVVASWNPATETGGLLYCVFDSEPTKLCWPN